MTVKELIDAVDALGVGVGSTIRDAIDDGLEKKLVAFINGGLADLYKIRPKRGFVVIDLLTQVQSDGCVDVCAALPSEKARDCFVRLDERSFATEDINLYGINQYAWTSDHIFWVCNRKVISDTIAQNEAIDEENARIEALNAEIEDEDKKIPLIPHKELTITITYRKRPDKVTISDLSSETDVTLDIDDDLAVILPKYVAGYLYHEENPATAEYYRSIYETRRNEIASREYNYPGASRVVHTNGW